MSRPAVAVLEAQAGRLGLPTPAPLVVEGGRTSFPGWLRALDDVHGAPRSMWAFVANALVVALVAAAAPVDPQLVVLGGSTLLLGLYLRRGFAGSSSLETQGIRWLAGHVSKPTVLTAFAGVVASGWLGRDPIEILFATGAVAGGIVGLRTVTWLAIVFARRSGLGLRRTLVVGSGKPVDLVADKLGEYPEAGLLPVAVLRLEADADRERFTEWSSDLARMVEEVEIDHVVLAPEGGDGKILDCVHASRPLDVHFSLLPPIHDVFMTPGLVTEVGGLPLVGLGRLAQERTALPGKRIVDVVLGGVLLFLASPLVAAAALAIWLEDRGPILYRQRRVGRNGRDFHMLKLRSMIPDADQKLIELKQLNVTDGLLFKAENDPRVTRVGRIIRRLSIDELPQLWNVLRGDMSLVGPRPLPVEPEDFGIVDNKRHSVPPGITGYWQVAGGPALTYEEMVKLDLAYIREWSLWLDFYLLLRTVPALIDRRGPA